MNIKDRIKQIDSQIKALKAEKKRLVLLTENTDPIPLTFEQRFSNWIRSNRGKMIDHYPGDDYPKLSEYLDRFYHIDRYTTEKLKDLFCGEIELFLADEKSKLSPWYRKRMEEYKLQMPYFKEVAEEIMDKNIRGFTNDW